MKTSVIPAGVTLAGEIEGRGELVVAGVVEGPIELEGALTIEDGGEVRGDVSVTALFVRGVLAGNASATEVIRVEPSAIVVGDARAPRVQIVDGARFRGRVQMSGEVAVAPRRRRTREAREERRPEPVAAPPERRTEAARPEPARPEPARPERPALQPREEAPREKPPEEAERPRKRRRQRRPPPPTIPAVQRQTARRKDGAV